MTDTLRTARAAYLDARAAEYAAVLALAEAVRDHVRAAVPAASWQVVNTSDRSQTYARTRHDAPGPTVWVMMTVDRMGFIRWRASLDWADWDTPAIIAGPCPDPVAALRGLLDAVRAKRRRVRRPDRRAELGVAATALAGWLGVA